MRALHVTNNISDQNWHMRITLELETCFSSTSLSFDPPMTPRGRRSLCFPTDQLETQRGEATHPRRCFKNWTGYTPGLTDWFAFQFLCSSTTDSSRRPQARLGDCSRDTDVLLARPCRVISRACASLAVLIVGILLSVNN